MSGPTQTAEWGAADQWRSRPTTSRLLRFAIIVFPILTSFGLSFWASKQFPPERIGVSVWIWWVAIALLAIVTMILAEKLARRFLPLAALLKLSLVFPDEAPSRFKSALRTGTTSQLAKELAHHEKTGEFSEYASDAEYLITLAKLIGEHDRLTRGHSERVRAYSDMIAEELGLKDDDRTKLHWAALLHDAGKLDVPSDVLNKPGRPTDEEWKILQKHPEAAIPYLEPLHEWLGDWVRVADEHHLRWDGDGYPNDTGGTDISLGGRIVAVADAYDVMTSKRSYKAAMPNFDSSSHDNDNVSAHNHNDDNHCCNDHDDHDYNDHDYNNPARYSRTERRLRDRPRGQRREHRRARQR